MDDEEKPSENSIRGQSMRKCRTHLRRPFQSEKSTGNDAPGGSLFERRGIVSGIPRGGTYIHRAHGLFQKRSLSVGRRTSVGSSACTIDGSFEILPRTGKWIHRHRMVLTIHEPIAPKGQGAENIKATMTEAYAAVESSLPEKFKGMVKNEDQDR